MATYYKYAERSADSQINWAEIGKNMTDMLQQEVDIRDKKKAALNEATRQAAEQISNAPQGQHQSAKAEAIRLADQSSKYLLMQDRLMKQGLLDPKDYMISRQNLSDGVKQAYTSMKAFQDNYAKLMERAQKDVSSAIELARLEKVQGYGNFNQSGFFIDAPTGNLNVGLKEEQIIDGKKVIGLKKGSSVGMQYIDGAIYGQIDKFKYMDPLKQMADGVGEFVTSTINPGTLSSIGYVTTISDARKRIDAMNIGENDKTILYDFYASSYDTINSILTNENHKASLLVDAMASKGYFWTDDPDVAAKNPKAVLEVIDPNTGRGVMKFSKEQDQAAADFMMQQFLGMIDIKEEKSSTGVIPRQDPSAAVLDNANKKADAENIAQNFVYALTGDGNQSNSGTKYLSGLTGIQFKKTKNSFIVTDADGKSQTYNLTTDGKIADPTELLKSFIAPLARETKINQDDIVNAFGKLLPKGATLNLETEATGFDEMTTPKKQNPVNRFNASVTADFTNPTFVGEIYSAENDADIRDSLNNTIGIKYPGIKFNNAITAKEVYIEAAEGRPKSPYFPVGNSTQRKAALKNIESWIQKNYLKGATLEEREAAAENWLGPDLEEGVLDD